MRCGDNLIGRVCLQCKQLLLNGKPLAYDGQDVLHKVCYDKALQTFAGVMKLARIGRAIAEYVYYRDNIGAP